MDRVRDEIGYEEVVRQQLSGCKIGIGVLDSGMFPHEDLKDSIVIFKDFIKKGKGIPYDDTGHGTHVCGILAGSGKMSKGRYRGMAPSSNLCVGKILNKKGEGDVQTLIDGLEWLLEIAPKYNIRVINISISSVAFGKEQEKSHLYRLFQYAFNNRILIVTAAGNAGPEGSSVSKLGDSPFVLCVGCHDGAYTKKNGSRCQDCSGRGPGQNVWRKPDLVAPGTDIHSCSLQYGKYTAKSGTSMATPVISGAVALAFEKYPNLSAQEMKRRLIFATRDLGESFLLQGFGMLDMTKLLK